MRWKRGKGAGRVYGGRGTIKFNSNIGEGDTKFG